MTDQALIEARMQTRRIAVRSPQDHRFMLWLRTWMQNKHLSQVQLAAFTGFNRNTVNNWCKGYSSPRAVDLPAIAMALGISIQELFIPPWEVGVDDVDDEHWPEEYLPEEARPE